MGEFIDNTHAQCVILGEILLMTLDRLRQELVTDGVLGQYQDTSQDTGRRQVIEYLITSHYKNIYSTPKVTIKNQRKRSRNCQSNSASIATPDKPPPLSSNEPQHKVRKSSIFLHTNLFEGISAPNSSQSASHDEEQSPPNKNSETDLQNTHSEDSTEPHSKTNSENDAGEFPFNVKLETSDDETCLPSIASSSSLFGTPGLRPDFLPGFSQAYSGGDGSEMDNPKDMDGENLGNVVIKQEPETMSEYLDTAAPSPLISPAVRQRKHKVRVYMLESNRPRSTGKLLGRNVQGKNIFVPKTDVTTEERERLDLSNQRRIKCNVVASMKSQFRRMYDIPSLTALCIIKPENFEFAFPGARSPPFVAAFGSLMHHGIVLEHPVRGNNAFFGDEIPLRKMKSNTTSALTKLKSDITPEERVRLDMNNYRRIKSTAISGIKNQFRRLYELTNITALCIVKGEPNGSRGFTTVVMAIGSLKNHQIVSDLVDGNRGDLETRKRAEVFLL